MPADNKAKSESKMIKEFEDLITAISKLGDIIAPFDGLDFGIDPEEELDERLLRAYNHPE